MLTDLTDLLNDFNLELQGKQKHVINMISAVNTFKSKLQLLSNRLQRYDLRNFPHMQAELQRQGKDFVQPDSARFEQVQSILLEFERRFTDFGSIEPVASYLCIPFGPSIDVDCIASKIVSLFHLDNTAVENEILTLQNDIESKSRATPDMNGEFWNLQTEQKYHNLRKCAFNLCERAFSHMKIIKSKYRSTMTDDHLLACLRLAASSYCSDYEKLAASSHCQRSH